MDIVLDSNIFRGDITLRSKEFDILLDYLSKTSSSVIVPQIIFDEIKGLYARTLGERTTELQKVSNNINLLMIDKSKYVPQYDFDCEKETLDYEKFVKNRLLIKDRNIIPYNNDYLPIISSRAINRIKPAGEKGQGFRDTLIWLTIKNYCSTCHEKQIAFISSNTDDFATSDKLNLHESLIAECDELKIKINYFKNLKEFIELHSIKIDFITYDWIAENLDDSDIQQLVKDDLNGSEKRSIISRIQSETGSECEGYRVDYVEFYDYDDMFVYEMSDNRLIVNLTMKANIGFEFDLRYHDFWNSDYEYHHSSTNETLKANVSVAITLQDKEIVDIDLSEIDI
jgi:hypothetical protein